MLSAKSGIGDSAAAMDGAADNRTAATFTTATTSAFISRLGVFIALPTATAANVVTTFGTVSPTASGSTGCQQSSFMANECITSADGINFPFLLIN